MKNIQKHLEHMFANEKTTLTHATENLLAEIARINLDSRALERLGRYILATISADLKSGIHTQKAMAAMAGGHHE